MSMLVVRICVLVAPPVVISRPSMKKSCPDILFKKFKTFLFFSKALQKDEF